MAFIKAGMSRVMNGGPMGSGPQNTHSLWMYASDDAVSAIAANGYFDPHADYLNQGDIVLVTGKYSTAPEAGLLTVRSINDGAVTMSGGKIGS